jgi:CheY-like chemotaxis protein
MRKQINIVMLVDDNAHDNFFHEKAIKQFDRAIAIVVKNSGEKALEYLKSGKDNIGMHPDIIFLDINMPQMAGNFLKNMAYCRKNCKAG